MSERKQMLWKEQEWQPGGKRIFHIAGWRTQEKGMMVVEAVLTFTVFLMVVLAILYLIPVFMLHNRVQYAINAAAHEISAYSYVYTALGLQSAEGAITEDGAPYTKRIDDTVAQVVDSLNRIQGLQEDVAGLEGSLQEVSISPEYLDTIRGQADKLAGDAEQTVDSVQKSAQEVTALLGDGKSLMAGILYMGVSAWIHELKGIGATAAAGALTRKYLSSETQEADEYLRACGIADGYHGLDFSGSTMFCGEDKRLIDIVVQYDIDLGFLGLVMPKKELHVVQRVSVAAWLNGDGKTVE